MYREIIEDYSAIPRFLQQQYGLNHGIDRGRIWKIDAKPSSESRGGEASASEPSNYVLSKLFRIPETDWGAETIQRLISHGTSAGLIQPFGLMLGARSRPDEVSKLLALLAKTSDAAPSALAVERALDGFLTGLPKTPAKLELSAESRKAFQSLIENSQPEVRTRMLELAGRWKLMDSPLVQGAFKRASEDAANRALSETARFAAIQLLANGPFEPFREKAVRLLTPAESIGVQRAVIQAAAPLKNIGVTELLLAGWSGYSPQLREAAMDAVFRQSKRLPALLTAIEKGGVSRALVSPLRRLQLMEHSDDGIRTAAKRLFHFTEGTSEAVDFEPCLKQLNQSRNLEAGRQLFQTHCLACHEFDGVGSEVGPSLSAERNREGATFLNDILRPNDQITAGYASYIVTTRDGDEHTGVMASESATSITLKQANAVEQVLLRRDIASLRAADLSIMPANFAELLTPGQAADLIGFLNQEAMAGVRERVVLFEDEAEFPGKLPDGSGATTLIEDNPFSGKFAIRLTPFQRHSVRIPGWDYAIREQPKPGEFRFMRFAWKAPEAKGVLVEMADSGRWPPAKKAARRYYSGVNTTEWSAIEVSSMLPSEWTNVTIDLWKDNGDMTLTGIALSALEGDAFFDKIELLRSLRDVAVNKPIK